MAPQTVGVPDSLTPEQQRAELERLTGQPVHVPEYTDPDLPDAPTLAEQHMSELISLRDPVNAERDAATQRRERAAAEIDNWHDLRGNA